ncbi:hypothetical protein BDV19DRAFT_389941 [Aspergillus venezuelensis]
MIAKTFILFALAMAAATEAAVTFYGSKGPSSDHLVCTTGNTTADDALAAYLQTIYPGGAVGETTNFQFDEDLTCGDDVSLSVEFTCNDSDIASTCIPSNATSPAAPNIKRAEQPVRITPLRIEPLPSVAYTLDNAKTGPRSPLMLKVLQGINKRAGRPHPLLKLRDEQGRRGLHHRKHLARRRREQDQSTGAPHIYSCHMMRGSMRPDENQYLSIEEGVLRTYNAETQALLGWSVSHSYRGHVDGTDPITLLGGREDPFGYGDCTGSVVGG